MCRAAGIVRLRREGAGILHAREGFWVPEGWGKAGDRGLGVTPT